MSVYPFYISADAEGRRSEIKGGTRRADGCMTTHVYQRSEGSITEPYTIRQRSVYRDNEHYLVTEVLHDNKVIHTPTRNKILGGKL